MPYVNYSIKFWPRLARRVLLLVCLTAFLGGCSLFTSPYPGPRSAGPLPPPSPQPVPQPGSQTSPSPPPPASQPAPLEPAPAPPAKATPKAQASLNITEQGKQLLLGGQAEEAISVLERATGLNPDNGEAYYWLAEAWLKKGNRSQALENHHQAWLRLRGEEAWTGRLHRQRLRIQGGGA